MPPARAAAEGAAVRLRRVLVSLLIGVSVCCHHRLRMDEGPLRVIGDQPGSCCRPMRLAFASVTGVGCWHGRVTIRCCRWSTAKAR